MRSSWTLLLAVALLAGCTESPATPAADEAANPSGTQTTTPVAGGAEAFLALGNVSLPAIHFAVGDSNSTRLLEGSFPTPNTCFLDSCDEQMLSFDLTGDVPAGAPVDLTITPLSNECVEPTLRLEDNGSVRDYEGDNFEGNLAARLVRSASSTVTLILWHCSTFSEPGATTVPVQVEVRSVVRSTVLPSYVPVAVDLQPGDQLLGMGEDLEDLVIVPPGQDPVHLLGPFEFQVTEAMPGGRYLVVAKGLGDTMLHGTAPTMQALAITTRVDEPHPLASGQDLVIDLPIPGVPLYAGVVLRSQPTAAGMAAMSFVSDHTVTFRQEGAELERYEQTGCLGTCGLTVLGSSTTTYPLGFLPEGLRAGPVSVTITNQASNAKEAYGYVGYVQL